jgi:hypothetical protein|uniref:Carboxypeptidase regulatory-like domain-containing protein n=1 Tax=Schlesneria paludicola TaxID=360056 RepID=A0A7C4LL71_9PLAN
MRGWVVVCSVLGVCLLVGGCGQQGPPRKPTFKVTGKVVVDGAPPTSSIQITCHSLSGMDPNMPTASQCETNPDGTFEIATYQQGDGVPVGDYVLTFTSREFNMMARTYVGPDKLNNRYADPQKSEFKFTVKDKPVDLGEIQLTTK